MAKGTFLLVLFCIAIVSSQEARPELCSLPQMTGPCEALFLRWFFNSTSGKCEEFNYGGCEGNENRFSSQKACTKLCDPETRIREGVQIEADSTWFVTETISTRTLPDGGPISMSTHDSALWDPRDMPFAEHFTQLTSTKVTVEGNEETTMTSSYWAPKEKFAKLYKSVDKVKQTANGPVHYLEFVALKPRTCSKMKDNVCVRCNASLKTVKPKECKKAPCGVTCEAPKKHNCLTREKWSEAKRKWCCKNEKKGCLKKTPKKHNCLTREKWSEAKRKWCCKNEKKGCLKKKTKKKYNCFSNTFLWTPEKTRWCCREEKLGCPQKGNMKGCKQQTTKGRCMNCKKGYEEKLAGSIFCRLIGTCTLTCKPKNGTKVDNDNITAYATEIDSEAEESEESEDDSSDTSGIVIASLVLASIGVSTLLLAIVFAVARSRKNVESV